MPLRFSHDLGTPSWHESTVHNEIPKRKMRINLILCVQNNISEDETTSKEILPFLDLTV